MEVAYSVLLEGNLRVEFKEMPDGSEITSIIRGSSRAPSSTAYTAPELLAINVKMRMLTQLKEAVTQIESTLGFVC